MFVSLLTLYLIPFKIVQALKETHGSISARSEWRADGGVFKTS